MNFPLPRSLSITLGILLCSNICTHAAESSGAAGQPAASADNVLMFGGCGGVYFLANPGKLEVGVVKRDRNRGNRHTRLRAILVGPDRHVVQEKTIADDGRPKGSGMGPPQWVSFTTQVERKGVYALNVTVSRDRYGRAMVWGFRANCSKYIIETARGHKDERHQEPIVLASPEMSAEICFRPRTGPFDLEINGLSGDVDRLQLQRNDGAVVKTMSTDAGKLTGTVRKTNKRAAIPWRLQLPSAQATVNIGGLTRWREGDLSENMCLWSPDPDSWFSFLEHRWLLTPYSRTVYAQADTRKKIEFRVHNNANRSKRVKLNVEFPQEHWPVRLTEQAVTVPAGKDVVVPVEYEVPVETGDTRQCHLRATPENDAEFSTYSTLTVTAGEAPADEPLDPPIMFKPYRHENKMFGYLPEYPLDNQMYFDLRNRPFVCLDGALAGLRGDKWSTRELDSSVRSSVPELNDASFNLMTTKVAFDADNDVYLLASGSGTPAYLHSTNQGETFTAYEIPGPRGRFDIEQFSGHNIPDAPPPFVRFVRVGGRHPGLRWRSENRLELFVPGKVNGRIDIGEPILISKMAIGLSAHSGIPSSVVSREDNVHVVWGEASDPETSRDEIPGVPTYAVTYNRDTERLGQPALLGYGPPPNDVHNTPSITMDGDGFLHVLIGTHGRPFQYTKSLRANDADGGWTEPVLAGEGLRQTYIGFVCGRDGTLHTVFRLWKSGEPFPHSTHATLAYQRKRPGQPWEPPQILCHAPFSEYSIFYHRLTIDQKGRLFLSKDYWSTYWFYRNDHFGDRRSLLMSPDGGDTWKLVSDHDLESGVASTPAVKIRAQSED